MSQSCDCKPSLESSLSWATAKEYRHIVIDNRLRIQNIRERGAIIKAGMIPGYSDFGPNEEADALAKAAARRDGSVVYFNGRKCRGYLMSRKSRFESRDFGTKSRGY